MRDYHIDRFLVVERTVRYALQVFPACKCIVLDVGPFSLPASAPH